MEERLMSAELNSFDNEEISLRPQTIDEYIGQAKSKGNLKINYCLAVQLSLTKRFKRALPLDVLW